MRIAFNPSTVAALTSPPNNKDITFDLRGQNIFARGVKFYGTDTNTWRDIKINNVSIGSHTLDLRNGSNTTLTNTNGVVTINSTWRPVVDNLTSNSTTSSLSANQGRVLAGLINGKSDSDHNHDDRYLKLIGGTLTGNLVGTSAMFSGRFYGSGNDEGIIIKPSSNGYAGLILGAHDGERSIFYFVKNKPFWRYSHGSDNLDIIHPKKSGTIALTSDIPSSLKNPYALTISLNGTSQGPYDGGAAKSINITPGSIGAATSDHNHDGRYVYNYGGTQMDGASVGKNALGMTTNSGVTGDWWHILQAAWNGEYRWNSQIAFPTQNRNGMYYRSGLDDNTKWGSWVKLLDTNNYSGVLDSRYYTESEVDSLLDAKLNRQNLSYGTWNPRGYNLAADYFYNGGDLSISESGGQIHVSVDGYFWQNEGRYRVLDTSDITSIRGGLTLYQYLSSTDNNWFPLVWGGSDHKNTNNSTGSLYKSHDKLSWQTSSQTLYATNIQTENIKRLSIGGGIFWNPNVESATDSTDAASITLVKSGVAGGTTLVLSQMNDASDTIQFKTNTAARLYHNSYPILTTQNTYVSNNKGYINGTEITQVNNADKVDNRHAISTIPNTGIIYKAAIYTSSSLTSYWVRLANIPSINQNNEFVATIHVQSGHSNPGRSAILLVYLRGAASSLSKSFKICCNSNYDPNRFRLYYKDSDKTSEIWYQTTGQWDGIITTVISQSSEGSLYEGLTLYSGSITAVQTPSMSTYLSAQVSTITDNISGNASTATKLATPRKIWGQSFDGTADVNGTIYINNGNSENGAIILNNNVNTHARISAIQDQVVFNTGSAIRFGGTEWEYSDWAGLKYDTTANTIYLGIADGTVFNYYSSKRSNGILKLPGITTVTPDSGARIGNTGGDLYLGNSNNAAWVKVQDMCSQADTNNWRIYQAGNAVFKSLNVVGNITAGGYVKNGSNDNYILLGGGGHKALSDFAYGNNYVKAFGTSNSNIDSDWGQSFKTFDPIPSGTPPEQNPNISLLSIGENFDRRKQLAFIWSNDNIYYRRRVGGRGFSNWRRLAFANEIPTSLPANGGNADTVDGEHASSFVRAGFVDNNGANLNSLDTYSFIKSVNSTVASASPGGYTGWYNVIQAVHKNGAGDGPGYIGQIALGMTTNLSAMFYRTKYNGSWYAWNEVLTTNTGLLRYSRNNVNISSPNCSPIPPSLLEWTVGYPRLYDPEFIDGNNDVNVYNNAGNGVVTVTRVHDTNVGNSSSYVMKVVSASGASPNYGGWNVWTWTELGKVYTCLFRASIPSGVEIEFNTNSIGSGGGAAWLTNNMGTGKWTWYAMQVYCGSGGSTTFFFSAKSPCTWYLSYVNVIENNRASYAGLRSVYSDYLKQNASLVFGRSELQYFNQYTGVTSGAKNNANPTTDWYHILRMNHDNNSGYFVDLAIPFNNNRIQFRRIVSGSDNGWRRVITEEPNHDVILREANTSGNVGIGINNPAYKLDVNGQIRASGFHHSSVNSDNYMLLAGGGYKSFGGDDSNPIFLGYLNLDHGNDGTISSSFSCLGYSVPFTYTRGGNYCRIYIPDTTHQVFYIKAATASVNYSGGGMDTWTGVHRGSGAWWLHCYAYGANEIRVKGFCQNNNNNDSWWGGNPLWSGNDGANKITVCIFGYVKFR